MDMKDSNTGRSAGLALFSKGDLSAFWALFADNLANLILIMGVSLGVLKIPAQVVFGRMLPGLGMALVVGLSSYAYMAHRLARKQKRLDVTALPYGISTPIMFVYLFGIMGPVYWKTHDGTLAWQVGLAAAFIGGLIEISGSLLGPWLKRNLPRAGMLGTLAGIALVFIASVPLAEVFEHPIIGLPCLVVVLVGLVAGVRFPLGIPAGLLAIILGVLLGTMTGQVSLNAEGIGFYPPIPVAGDLWAGLRALWTDSWIFAVVIPAEIYNFIETMNNVESAQAAGDEYLVASCQIIDGVGTLVGSLFGSAFPTTVYIGHPGYKRMGGRAGYAMAVGVVLLLASLFGLLSVIHGLVPMAAVAPILVFIGLVITAQAFSASPSKHSMAVTLAMLPHLSNLLMVKWGALRVSAEKLLGGSLPKMTEPEMLSAMLLQGAHVAGHATLSAGAIMVGMAWGAAAAFIIDRSWIRASVVLAVSSALAFFGVIHSSGLGLYPGVLPATYLALSMTMLLLWYFKDQLGSVHEND